MNISIKVRFLTAKGRVLCFMHAAQRAAHDGEEIVVEADVFNYEGDMRSLACEDCAIRGSGKS